MKYRLALLILPLLLLTGCPGPNASFVAAERATHDAISDEYRGYSQADPNKSDADKARDARLLDQWEKDLTQVESELKGGK